MTQARKTQISLGETPCYHCYVRCICRAFLCGEDNSGGITTITAPSGCVSHLEFLSYIYSIDICAYRVISNREQMLKHLQRNAAAKAEPSCGTRWGQSVPTMNPLANRLLLVSAYLTEALKA